MFESLDPSIAGPWQLAAMALEYANDAIVICERGEGDPPFVIRYVNAAFERQTGFAREEALGKSVGILYGPLTDRNLIAEFTRSLAMGNPVLSEVRKYRKDGTAFWAEVSIRPIFSPDGALEGSVIVQRDVTERIDTKEELELLSRAIDYANDAIAIFRWDTAAATWRIRHVNEMFLAVTGYEIGEVVGRTSNFLIGERTDKDRLAAFRTALLAGEPVRGEIAFYRKDGSHFWTEINGQGLRDADGAVANTIIVYREITEKYHHVERLSFEAAHDPLTGAFNRRFFVHTLDGAVQDAKARDVMHGLIFFDLDGFKRINDEHGHDAGDRLLLELTAAVHAHLRSGDVFGRLGGDEFALMLLGCPRDQTERIAHQLLDIVRALAVSWHGLTLCVGASIGAVAVDSDTKSAADALRHADQACYAAKHGGRNRVVVGAANG